MSIHPYELVTRLDEYICRRFAYKRAGVRYSDLFETISVDRVKIQLYLRTTKVRLMPEGCLTIAAIQFKVTQRGHGTSFLRFIVDVADFVGIKSVGVESVLSAAGDRFVRSFGFRQLGDGKDWWLPIAKLRDQLDSRLDQKRRSEGVGNG